MSTSRNEARAHFTEAVRAPCWSGQSRAPFRRSQWKARSGVSSWSLAATGPDGFKAGDPGTVLTGIATTAMATLDVLKQAVKAKMNQVLPTLWLYSPASFEPIEAVHHTECVSKI